MRSESLDKKRASVTDVVTQLKIMCPPPHRVFIANEMAIQHLNGESVGVAFDTPSKDRFNHARLLAFNRELYSLTQGLQLLDVYNLSAAFFPNTGNEPYAHYYEGDGLGGNAASRAVANMFWQLV